MRVLVTGATGFIGNNLIKELLNLSNVEIITTSRDTEKAKKFDWFVETEHIPFDIDNNEELNLFNYFCILLSSEMSSSNVYFFSTFDKKSEKSNPGVNENAHF